MLINTKERKKEEKEKIQDSGSPPEAIGIGME
jgi:hypothetical protein